MAKLVSPEYRRKQLEKARLKQEKQRDKQMIKLTLPEYRQEQLDKTKLKQQVQRRKIVEDQVKNPIKIASKAVKKVNSESLTKQREASLLKQRASQKKSLQKQRDKQMARLSSPEYQTQQRDKVLAKPVVRRKSLKGRARTAEEKRLEALLACIGCICCKNKGWYTTAMNSEEGQHFISMHHVDGRTKPWSHAKQLPLCQYHHDTAPPQGAPEQLFPLHGTGRKLWEKVNGTENTLLAQVYDMVGEIRPWLQDEKLRLRD